MADPSKRTPYLAELLEEHGTPETRDELEQVAHLLVRLDQLARAVERADMAQAASIAVVARRRLEALGSSSAEPVEELGQVIGRPAEAPEFVDLEAQTLERNDLVGYLTRRAREIAADLPWRVELSMGAHRAFGTGRDFGEAFAVALAHWRPRWGIRPPGAVVVEFQRSPEPRHAEAVLRGWADLVKAAEARS